MSQLAKPHDVHPTQIHEWKRRVLGQASSVFDRGNAAMKTEDFDAAELYEEIRTDEDGAGVGQNKLHSSVSDKRRCVQPESCGLSIVGQCELLGLPRSTYYDESATESAENLELKRRIDEQYLQTPFFGSRRMTEELSSPRQRLNRNRVQRLMRIMDISSIFRRTRPLSRAWTIASIRTCCAT